MLKETLENRSEVAAYLGVTRMTLSRWEKKSPLPTGNTYKHVKRIKTKTVDIWYQELIKRYWWLDLHRKKRLSSTNVT